MTTGAPESQKQINFRLPEEEYALVRLMASTEQQSIAEFAQSALLKEVTTRMEDGWDERFSENLSTLISRFRSNSE